MHALLSLLLAGGFTANAAPVPDDHNADIVSEVTVGAPPATVFAWVSDLRNQEAVLGDCTRKWSHAEKNVGIGASAQLVYKVGMFRRKLVGTISKTDPDRRVLVDHAGNKGFITTWTLTPAQDGASTRVELRTLLNLPGKPWRGYYVNKVQPAWEACYEAALLRVDEKLGHRVDEG